MNDLVTLSPPFSFLYFYFLLSNLQILITNEIKIVTINNKCTVSSHKFLTLSAFICVTRPTQPVRAVEFPQ